MSQAEIDLNNKVSNTHIHIGMITLCENTDNFHASIFCSIVYTVAMGVKDLWDVLEPAHKNTPVEHLRGKTLAVDLSVWLHQGMKVAKLRDKQAIKPHIR